MKEAYLIDAASGSYIEAVAAPFDYAYAGSLWSLAFTFVLGLYLVAKHAGIVLAFIRRG